MGIVLQYAVDNKPVERLLQFLECEQTTWADICNNILEALAEAGLDVKLCRSKTMDGACICLVNKQDVRLGFSYWPQRHTTVTIQAMILRLLCENVVT